MSFMGYFIASCLNSVSLINESDNRGRSTERYKIVTKHKKRKMPNKRKVAGKRRNNNLSRARD